MGTHRFGLVLPIELWEHVTELAKRHRRSINQEILVALEQYADESDRAEKTAGNDRAMPPIESTKEAARLLPEAMATLDQAIEALAGQELTPDEVGEINQMIATGLALADWFEQAGRPNLAATLRMKVQMVAILAHRHE